MLVQVLSDIAFEAAVVPQGSDKKSKHYPAGD